MMNPLMAMMGRQMPGVQPTAAGGALGAAPPAGGLGAALAGLQDPSQMTAMMSALGAVQSPNVDRQPQAPVTYPDAPRAMNPAFAQMILQALQGGGMAGQVPGLGAALMGR